MKFWEIRFLYISSLNSKYATFSPECFSFCEFRSCLSSPRELLSQVLFSFPVGGQSEERNWRVAIALIKSEENSHSWTVLIKHSKGLSRICPAIAERTTAFFLKNLSGDLLSSWSSRGRSEVYKRSTKKHESRIFHLFQKLNCLLITSTNRW